MAIKVTTWSLDSCGCVISYEHDDTVPAEARIHGLVSHRQCRAHDAHPAAPKGTQWAAWSGELVATDGAPSAQQHALSVVLRENLDRSAAKAAILQRLGYFDQDGNPTSDAPEPPLELTYDSNGNLRVRASFLTHEHLKAAQAALSARGSTRTAIQG